jgi:hypothetical protein
MAGRRGLHGVQQRRGEVHAAQGGIPAVARPPRRER